MARVHRGYTVPVVPPCHRASGASTGYSGAMGCMRLYPLGRICPRYPITYAIRARYAPIHAISIISHEARVPREPADAVDRVPGYPRGGAPGVF